MQIIFWKSRPFSSSITSARLGVGLGILSHNADTADALKGTVGELKHRSIAVKYLKSSKTNEFLPESCPNILKYSSNAPNRLIEKHILIIWNVLYKSSSKSHPIQVLNQQIRGEGAKIWENMLMYYMKTPLFVFDWG